MGLPLAVSPSTLTPGVYMTVDLLAGAASPGTGVINILIIAPKTSAGDLTVDTEIRTGGGVDSAKTAWGVGSLGALCAAQLYAQDPAATVDFSAPTAGSGSATISITASGSPTADTAVNVTIMGRLYQIPWLNGESADTWKARAVTFLQSKTAEIFVTPSSGGVGVLTLTAKTAGKVGNDVLVKAALAGAQTSGGTEAVAGAATPTALSGGSTDFDVTTLMTHTTGKEYHFIVLCTSSADAQAGSSSNPLRIKTTIGNVNHGLNAKLEQLIVASIGALSAAKTGAIAFNSPVGEHVNCVNGQSLPAEWAGFEAGSRSAAIKIDPAQNRIGTTCDGLFASFQPTTDTAALATTEDAIGNGVSFVNYTANLTPILIRPITMYSQDSSGGADRRCLDLSNVDGTYIVSRDVRDNLPLAFPNAKIVKDAPPNAEAPDIKGVVEERDIRGWVIDRLRFWRDQGVVDSVSLETAIANGTLIVQVDGSDATQVDIVIPFKIVKPLAKFSVYAQRFN